MTNFGMVTKRRKAARRREFSEQTAKSWRGQQQDAECQNHADTRGKGHRETTRSIISRWKGKLRVKINLSRGSREMLPPQRALD